MPVGRAPRAIVNTVNICHVSARLPAASGASAIQPVQIAAWCREAGDDTRFVAYDAWPAQSGRPRAPARALPGPVTLVAAPRHVGPVLRAIRAMSFAIAPRPPGAAIPDLQWGEVVHAHGGSRLAQAALLFAARSRKPAVLTLYGPELARYRKSPGWTSTFARAYHAASHVTFTSHGLLERAVERGLARRDVSVIYPPAAAAFGNLEERWRTAARTALNVRARHLLVCVRALDATGGHRTLLEALNEVVRTHPDTRLVLIGTGPELRSLEDAVRAWGVEGHVTFAGRVDHDRVAQDHVAADAFVLPSTVDGVPLAAIEALASGCPVIISDTDGGRELHELFGFDVALVPRDNATALARAIVHALEEKRRVRPVTSELIDAEHRCHAVCAEYRDIYAQVLARGAAASPGA